MMKILLNRRLGTAAWRAFSMVELLAVIAIVALLLAVAVTSLRSPSTGVSVKGAVDAAASMVDLATGAARMQQTGSRLVVNVDSASEGFLRQMAVLRFAENDDEDGGGVSGWMLDARPQLLPQGIYFDREASSGFETMNVDFRSGEPQTGSGGTETVYFEFDANGHFQPGDDDEAKMVFVAGIIESNALVIPAAREGSRDGFLLRRHGQVTRFESPDQIQ